MNYRLVSILLVIQLILLIFILAYTSEVIFSGENTRKTIPYLNSSNENIVLINNESSENVSFNRLKNFLINDTTDRKEYNNETFTCGNYAQVLHNNAESKGIKTGLVVVKFKEGSFPHALNIFYTTDRGRVYIDSTGVSNISEKRVPFLPNDKVAYVKVGKSYGQKNILFAKGTNYSYYKNTVSSWKEEGCVKEIETFW